jgi:hypothetical protein
VTLVGRSARRALAAEPAWRVLAVFRRSFYCRSARGSLVLVAPESLGAGPLHALWSEGREGRPPHAEEGMPVGIDLDGARACAREPLTLGLRDARDWTPPSPPRWRPARVRRSLDWLGDAGARTPVEGLGGLLAPVASRRLDCAAAARSSLQRLASPAVAALAAWVRAALAGEAGAERPPDAIGALIGLGPGLTPSGDDVLAGALLALHALDRADVAERVATWLDARLEGRTGLVSRAHLACAARGAGAAVLHDALGALASGDGEALAAATSAVGTLGHCSGWDGLVGIAAVTAAWLATADGGEDSTPCR